MSKLKKLENIKLIKELEFIESEFNYKNEIVLEADTNFLKTVNSYLSSHPELKKIFDDKINQKIEQMINKKKKSQAEVNDDEEDYIKSISDDDKEQPKDVEEKSDSSEKSEEVEVDEYTKNRNDKIKKIYREIVKLTHPDKIKNSKMNTLYIKATEYYDKNDLLGLYLICSDLNLDFEIVESDNVEISGRIDTLKGRINFLESTFTWKWHHTENPTERESIILKYISSQLNS